MYLFAKSLCSFWDPRRLHVIYLLNTKYITSSRNTAKFIVLYLYNILHNYMFRPFFRQSSGCIRLALRFMYPDDKFIYFIIIVGCNNVIIMVLLLIIADYSDVFIGRNVRVDWFMFFVTYGQQLDKFTRCYCALVRSFVSFPVVFRWVRVSWLCVFARSVPAS